MAGILNAAPFAVALANTNPRMAVMGEGRREALAKIIASAMATTTRTHSRTSNAGLPSAVKVVAGFVM